VNSARVRRVHARQILDSRGRPTVEVDVELDDGMLGRAAVPSGASTGTAEAHELRDGDPEHYDGRGVTRAVANVNGEIARALHDCDAVDQRALDARLLDLDGTANLTRLGANAVLGVSMAACRAVAASRRMPLYAHIAALCADERMALTMPLPMVNILSGGLHAGRGMDVQDFLAVPVGATSIAHAIEMIARARSAATEVCATRSLPTLLADEGGLSPGLASSREALDLMLQTFERARLRPGTDVAIAIDVAATALQTAPGTYAFAREDRVRTSAEVIALVESWTRDYPVVSVEDALAEEDWDAWQGLTNVLGKRVQLVGDDLFATNPARLARGIAQGVGNAALIKLNQNGTVSGTLDTIALAREAGYATVVSARSGETEDAFIADLAVGSAAGQIKIGSLRSSERLAKYNQLLRIEEATRAPFAGRAALAGGS